MFRQRKIDVPPRDQDHIISQIFSLYFQLLEDDDISLERIEHAIEGPLLSPWVVPEGIADAVDVPCRNADTHSGNCL